jgi:hypothetical protein
MIMRLGAGDVLELMKTVIRNDLVKEEGSVIRLCLRNTIKGGWEAWLQVEIARQIMLKHTRVEGARLVFSREGGYPFIEERCDLVIKDYLEGERGGTTFIDIITPDSGNEQQAFNRFKAEITRLSDSGPAFFNKYNPYATLLLTFERDTLLQLNELKSYIWQKWHNGIKGTNREYKLSPVLKVYVFRNAPNNKWVDISALTGEDMDLYFGNVLLAGLYWNMASRDNFWEAEEAELREDIREVKEDKRNKVRALKEDELEEDELEEEEYAFKEEVRVVEDDEEEEDEEEEDEFDERGRPPGPDSFDEDDDLDDDIDDSDNRYDNGGGEDTGDGLTFWPRKRRRKRRF